MQNKRYDRINENKDWGMLSVTPEHVFRVDKDKEFEDFTHLSDYLDVTIQSKLDLIALLHFSDLKRIETDLFFTLSGIDTEELLHGNPKEAMEKFKDKLFSEQVKKEFNIEEGGGPILRTHSQRKKAFPIKFDDFLFEHGGVYTYEKDKHVPQTEAEQKEFLSQLIYQGFFAVQDSYKNRDRLLRELILNMGFFAYGNTGSTYPREYTKRIIMEGYTRGKLSDYCLGALLTPRLKDTSVYAQNIFTYLEELRPYPELIKKIFACMEIYFTQKKK